VLVTPHALCAQAEAHFRFGVVPPLGRTIRAYIHEVLPASALPTDEWPHASYDVVLSDLYDGSNPLASLASVGLDRIKAVLRPSGVLAANIVAHLDGPHARLTIAAVHAVRGAFAHVRAFADRDPSVDPLEPTNILLFASDAPIRFAPPPLRAIDEWGTLAPEGTVPHLHSSFIHWEPPVIRRALAELARAMPVALAGLEPSDYEREQAEVVAAMAAVQRELVPEEGWALLSRELRQSSRSSGDGLGGAPSEIGAAAAAHIRVETAAIP